MESGKLPNATEITEKGIIAKLAIFRITALTFLFRSSNLSVLSGKIPL